MNKNLKIVFSVLLCCVIVFGWMLFIHFLIDTDILLQNFGGRIASIVYRDEIRWMKGKTIDEIEARFGPIESLVHGYPVFWKWYIYVPANGDVRVDYASRIDEYADIERPFKIDTRDFEMNVYIVNFVGSTILVLCSSFVLWLLRKKRKTSPVP
ncbi:MAG: hypothetical protein J6C26_06040 [Clostridia bacterium]|nr:hypothetical protein [Clostridia bacterium]